MKHLVRCFFCASALLSAATVNAGFVAYQVTSPTNASGNHGFGGSVGSDFQVNQSIDITHLGAFDSLGNGLNSTITVKIWSKTSFAANTGVELISLQLFGSTDPITLEHRFSTLVTPLTLGPGFYTVSASGYSSTEQLGNANNPGLTLTRAVDSGGGLLTFGQSRFSSTPAVFPSTSGPFSSAGGPHVFVAGSFMYEATQVTTPIPEPSGLALVLCGVTAFGVVRGRRALKLKRN